MRLVVVGADGRMGRMLVRAVAEAEGCTLAAAIEREGSPVLGQDAGVLAGLPPLDVPVTDDPLKAFATADGVLDFTAPAATVQFAELAAQARIVHVVGTTGLSDDDLAKLRAAAYHARIVRSGNMSLGINLMAELVRRVAKALSDEFDIEIAEMHHRMKVDAPSGTALLLGEAAAEGRGVDLKDVRVSTRDGHTGARRPGDIGFATLRGGCSQPAPSRPRSGHTRSRRGSIPWRMCSGSRTPTRDTICRWSDSSSSLAMARASGISRTCSPAGATPDSPRAASTRRARPVEP
jgi:4-hydroxy-tetrahydrodipicolinate reductase